MTALMSPLGEFETIVLLAVLHLGPEAYGSTIRDVIEQRTGRPVARGAIYVTLDRLEEKGFLRSTLADPTPARGGRPRRHVRVTARGLKAVRQATEMMARMQAGLETLLGER
jgi:PadR family transcriptional regulator PadR